MGRQVRARLRSQPDAARVARAGAPWTLPEQEGRSSPSCLGPPPLRQESGRPPRPALPASGSPPGGSTAPHSGMPGPECWRSAESARRPGSGRQPGPGPPAPSLRRPTGRAPRDPGLPEPLATFVQGGERCGLNICIYIFNCQKNLPSGKDQRVPRAARGRGSRLAAEGLGFAAGVALGPLRSWAPDAGFVAPGKLSARSAWAPSAERGWGTTSGSTARAAPSLVLPETREPCPAGLASVSPTAPCRADSQFPHQLLKEEG